MNRLSNRLSCLHALLLAMTGLAGPAAVGGDCPTSVIEFERDAAGWLAAAPGAEAAAFDEFFPGVQPGGGCLVAAAEAEVPLAGGTITVSGSFGAPPDSDCCQANGTPGCEDPECEALICSSDPFCCDTAWDAICAGSAETLCQACIYCPVRDGGSGAALSDASLLEDATLVMTFEPPVSAFQTFYGSLQQGTTASMALYADDVLVATLGSATSPHNSSASGHGFVSTGVLIDRIVFTADTSGNTLIGAFTSIAAGDTSLGTVEIPGYDGPNGSTVNLDFACVFGPLLRVDNLTAGTSHVTLCEAITAAEDGDEIVAQPFVYDEAVDFEGKAITLRSTDPSAPAIVASTIIDASGFAASAVVCRGDEGPDTVLDGFTVRNGSGTDVVGETRGGGMYNFGTSPTVQRCRFEQNFADLGGGMYNDGGGTPTVIDCVFDSNGALSGGGGMYNDAASPTVESCQFIDGFLETGGGGGMHNANGSAPLVIDCLFDDNSGTGFGGGMSNDASSPTVSDCTFVQNFSFEGGAGMTNVNGSGPAVLRCTFDGNNSGSGNGLGGGMYSEDSTPVITNCVFTGNIGGAMANESSTVAVTNCSFGGNLSFGGAAGSINCNLSIVTIDNSILWGSDAATEISNTASTVTVTHSNIDGGWAGVGNIDANPMFTAVGSGDLHLLPGSPSIDAGDNDAPGLVGVTTDHDGLARFQDDPDSADCPQDPGGCGMGPNVDMGAFEIPGIGCAEDVDGDGTVGVTDLIAVIVAWGTADPAADIDGDGIVGVTDLVAIVLAWGDC